MLALSNPTEDVLGVGQSGAFDLAFDFSAPEAPQNLTARDGESGFIVSWDASSDQISQYEVFVVDGCGTTIDPDSLSPTSTIDGPAGSTEVSFDASTPFGAEFTVAVRAIDSAGNASALSDSACVTRIEVDSWWDVYCNGPDRSADACSGGGGCAVGPGTPSPAVGGIWLATAMLLALIRRRR